MEIRTAKKKTAEAVLEAPDFIVPEDPALEGCTPLTATAPPASVPARTIAFYLPQFHPIPENNKWWGGGFTEWTRVKPAKPLFDGHYQPHEPGELGYYDLLRDERTMSRQAELAHLHGLGGFCFYFYWFAGKRLLDAPLEKYLNDQSIDFPFCLCWANENWSRRWDGLEEDILIAQNHSPEDDLAFIQHVSRYLRDPRYIRINGRPLLLVYRPALLPLPKETAARWRRWCRENEVGEIYLAYTQSFETDPPVHYGFDAAIEFPPNNTGLAADSTLVDGLDDASSLSIYDWRKIAAQSAVYRKPDYTLFRGVNPSWDNTPRRSDDGAVLVGSSPSAYKAWLKNAIDDTKARIENPDEQLVFINAWNEWAEGAHLEPDCKFGYAWLEATRRALVEAGAQRKIIVVVHDLHKHGAQYLSLNMARTLKGRFGYKVAIIAGEDGALHKEFASLGPVAVANKSNANEIIANLVKDGFAKAIVNSAASGWSAPFLAKANIQFVGLVHELPSIIDAMDLTVNLKYFDQYANRVIFPSQKVCDIDSAATGIDWRSAEVLPQGLYKRDAVASIEQKETARKSVLARLGLSGNERIILGAGYADHRKGIDIFIRWGLALAAKNPGAHAIWMGKIDPLMKPVCDELLEAAGDAARNIRFPGFVENTGAYYAAADLYALTSREDPFPSTALEALAGGAPVIMLTGAGGIEDLTGRECVIALDDSTSDVFVEAALPLIGSQSSARARLGLIGRDLIRAEFGFASYMGDLLRLLDEPCPKVSVVVPNYNYAKHLEQRLRSILDQTLPPWEIIFLDDASTDESIDIAEKLLADADIRYRIIRNDRNSGSVFAQWRKGAELARGDFIWIAEADDWADPAFLETAAAPFATDEGLTLSYTQSNQADAKGNVICPHYLEYVADVDPDRWRRGYHQEGSQEVRDGLSVKNTIPNVSGVIFRAATLQRVLSDKFEDVSQYRVAGDWLVYVNVLRHGGIAFDPRPLNFHRRHDESVTIRRFGLEELAEIAKMQTYVMREFDTPAPMNQKAHAYLQHLVQEYSLVESYGADAVATAMRA